MRSAISVSSLTQPKGLPNYEDVSRMNVSRMNNVAINVRTVRAPVQSKV